MYVWKLNQTVLELDFRAVKFCSSLDGIWTHTIDTLQHHSLSLTSSTLDHSTTSTPLYTSTVKPVNIGHWKCALYIQVQKIYAVHVFINWRKWNCPLNFINSDLVLMIYIQVLYKVYLIVHIHTIMTIKQNQVRLWIQSFNKSCIRVKYI